MSIRLVDRADVVDMDTIVLFDAFERCGDELSEFAVAIILQIDGAAAPVLFAVRSWYRTQLLSCRRRGNKAHLSAWRA